MKKGMTVLTLLLVFGISADAWAFNNPPGGRWNDVPGGWDKHPNARHVETDADTEQLEVTTLWGPPWDEDPWDCDEVIWVGDAQWYDTAANWGGHQGLVGIDNTQGLEEKTGAIVFHVNNFPDENPEKWVWDEIIFYASCGATINHKLQSDVGTTVTYDIKNFSSLTAYGYPDTDPGHLENLDGTVKPNPAWEELVYEFVVPAGEEAYIDSFEIATICFPEPATMALLVLGAAAMIARKRRA